MVIFFRKRYFTICLNNVAMQITNLWSQQNYNKIFFKILSSKDIYHLNDTPLDVGVLCSVQSLTTIPKDLLWEWSDWGWCLMRAITLS